MLAEPRRKQKIINLRAKNNAWSNDNTKFGQRMLEKMGWSTGKGLGVKEDGIVEHVIARYKNDEKGLGYEDRNDQWTKHEDDFNSLLAELSNGSDSKETLHSGVSLELKSKKSKARVHYHKFTRGKDLSRYSEKDLACIFGKKTLKKEDGEQKCTKEKIKVTNQVFTEKGSMEEYFKNKMTTIKSMLGNENVPLQDKDDDKKDFAFQGFSGTSSITYENEKYEPCHQPYSFYNVTSIDSDKIDCADGKIKAQNKTNQEEIKKKGKKTKKKNLICQLNSHNVEDEQNELMQINSYKTEYKQNKIEKSKAKVKSSDLVFSELVEKIKTKKKKKNKISPESESPVLHSKKRKFSGNTE
ncbi:hypothetical protein EVAR_80777_1 [Eumeta japonica]|uniref:G-patch domain-containing protein n=1 Tax=Eumeta variegata TaxID=151549 RepID=A0A4C1X8T0_EUMVA|nr:hypothetical protein EVAR_80777_1 [Eumeta japonica]